MPSAAARSLRTGLTGMLTVISPNITNPFFAELFRDIQHFASNYGYTTILQTQDDTHAPTLFDRLSWNGSVGVDGIIVCFPDDDTVVDYVNRYCPETPIVYLTWHPLNERVQSAVLLDVENGLYIATRHLLSQGHRLIGYIGAPDTSITSKEKFKGYVAALAQDGIAVSPEFVFHGPYGLETGYRAAESALRGTHRPTAVVTESDVFAIGCIKYCLHNARSVPNDMAVTGFDDIPMANMYEPPLTTVRLPVTEMAHAAVDKLHALIARRGEAEPLNKAESIFYAKLIVRRSTDPNYENQSPAGTFDFTKKENNKDCAQF
ncbi:MAG: LacI family DNA-binding transcriptional regulator [Clostridia bacterium]